MGSGGGSSGDNTVRYAGYWEAVHKDVLNNNGSDWVDLSIVAAFNAAVGKSPYGGVAKPELEDAFFTAGYSIASYPSLWDMFGKFMAGLDVHTLWAQTFEGISSSGEINDVIETHAQDLQDEIEQHVYPTFHAGMRDINAVQSSAFAVGRALIEDTRIKAVNKFASEIRIRALDSSVDMWKSHLEWNKSVVATFSHMFKLYYSAQMDVEKQAVDYEAADILWDLKLYEYIRAVMGVVSGAQGTSSAPEPSQAAKSVSGALGGAAMGAQVGGPWGAVVGGVVGLAASFL